MSDGSAIEWTDATWNPTTGCTKVSDGCKFCYAEAIANRLQGGNFETVKTHASRLGQVAKFTPLTGPNGQLRFITSYAPAQFQLGAPTNYASRNALAGNSDLAGPHVTLVEILIRREKNTEAFSVTRRSASMVLAPIS